MSTNAVERSVYRQRGQHALILSECSDCDVRLPYRTLRCADNIFSRIYVLGTNNSRILRLSNSCYKFVPSSGPKLDTIDLSTINQICEDQNIVSVLPACSASVRYIAANRGQITAPCFPGPGPSTFDSLNDKWQFSQLCSANDVPHPGSWLFDNRDDLHSAILNGRIKPPFVVKPLRMSGSIGVFKIDHFNLSDVGRIDYEPILVQDYVKGEDLSAFFLCEDGKIQLSTVYRKTHSNIHFLSRGSICVYAERIVSSLNYNGVLGFDVREAPDGSESFIECNPRFWYNIDLVMLGYRNFVDWENRLQRDAFPPPSSIVRPWGLARKLWQPWRIDRDDHRVFLHIVKDPIPLAYMILRRVAGRFGIGSGLQF